jgi:hypothetical protein
LVAAAEEGTFRVRRSMSDEAIGPPLEGKVLDLRAVFGVVARVTIPAETTGGEYVEMDITADPGAKTLVHIHPEIDTELASRGPRRPSQRGPATGIGIRLACPREFHVR